jgi:catechol 2,3-dioxygenase-like lactoylglutathione lyase family enzyme
MNFAAAAVIAAKAYPQTGGLKMTDTSTSTRITQLATVMVPVTDQDRAIDFYVGKLGFEKLADIPFGDGDRWVEVSPPGAATSIALVLPREGESVGIQTRIGLKTEDADADHADLLARGVDVDPEVMRMGDPVPPMFFFRDPDGNNLMAVQTG